MDDDPDSGTEQIRITKVPLKSVVKNKEILCKINDIVNRSNDIVIHTYMFIKLYFLYCINEGIDLPKLDLTFVRKCIDVVCNDDKNVNKKFNNKNTTKKQIDLRNKKIENQKLKLELHKFFVGHFYPLTKYNKIDIYNFRDITDYLVKTIITVFETNIKENYFNYVARYINIKFKKKETIDSIKTNDELSDDEKKIDIRKFCKFLADVKYNFVDVNYKNLKYDEEYMSYDDTNIIFETAVNNKDKYEKDSIHYDLKCNPQEYFVNMINMMKEIEESGEKILNVFPLRSEIIPKFTTIDTTAIIRIFIDASTKMGTKKQLIKSISPKNNKVTHKENKNKIWNKFFNIDSKYFKRKGYEFRNMIQTDGITCNIYFTKIKTNNVDKVKKNVKKQTKTDKKIQNISSGKVYLENYADKLKYKKYKIVGIDPGVNNIISCVDDINKSAKTFRYSRVQRMKEIGTKKFRRTISSIKTFFKDIKDTDVTGLETELSKISKKTLDFDKFKSYIKLKCETNAKLKEFYNLVVHRKNKFRSYQNTKKSEQVMLNNFSKKFGSPDNTIICIGDYKRSGHMKYKEPTKGIGMRKLFIDRGYKLFLIDEFRTSCICSKCRCEEGRCENTIKRPDPRPWINKLPKKNNKPIPEENDPSKPKKNDDPKLEENDDSKSKENGEEKEEKIVSRLVHGLLCCKNIKCKSYWNRDINGATNILRIAKSIMKNKKRPKELRRTNIKPRTIDTTSVDE